MHSLELVPGSSYTFITIESVHVVKLMKRQNALPTLSDGVSFLFFKCYMCAIFLLPFFFPVNSSPLCDIMSDLEDIQVDETATTTTTTKVVVDPTTNRKTIVETKKDDFDYGKLGKMEGICIYCKMPMGKLLGTQTPEGSIHNDCVPGYKRRNIERCAHCDCELPAGKRSVINGKKLHPECVADFKAKKVWVPPTKTGILQKFAVGKSFLFGSKNWKQRFFVLSQKTGFAYFETNQEYEKGAAPKGKVTFTPQTRLVTHPSRSLHREAMNPSKEFIVIFFEGGKERKLLVAASSWQEHDEWTKVLQAYIKIVDDPADVQDL